MSAVVELLLAAGAYGLLRGNVGRTGPAFAAAAQVYRRSYWPSWEISVAVPPECMPERLEKTS